MSSLAIFAEHPREGGPARASLAPTGGVGGVPDAGGGE